MGLGRPGFPSLPPQEAKPLAADAPLLEAFVAATRGSRTPFSVPGHKHRAGALDADLGLAADPDIPLYGGLDAMKLTGMLRGALDGLPGRQREVVLLRDVEGLTSTEVCSVLSISEANQRVLLHRGRGKLRQVLETELGGGSR